MPIKPGEPVPDFSAVATGAKTVSLGDYRGRYVLVYFYPKDHTPGCTQQAQDFRDHIAEFQQLNCVVLGVSRDSVKTHENFKAKQQLPFELLSDPDEQLCELFQVIGLKTLYGKQVRGIVRSSFLIDPEGRLLQEWRKVTVKTHIADVLTFLTQLSAH